MRELKVDIPSKFDEDAEEVLKKYTDEVSSSDIEKDDRKYSEISVTIDQEDLDEVTEELKSLDVKSGDLSIKVFEQESLIEKGKSTQGASNTILSNQEIYSKAQKSAELNRAQLLMLLISGGIAGIGLTTGNIIVLIGAILLAPILYPISSLSVSMAMGDTEILKKSLKSILQGIALITVTAAPVFYIFGESQITVLLSGLEMALLSIFVGGAGVLTFISEYKEEMAGAALAVAVVPPLAVISESIYLTDISRALQGLEVLSVNLLAATIAGYLVLIVFKVEPLTEYRKKIADNVKLGLGIICLVFLLLLITSL